MKKIIYSIMMGTGNFIDKMAFLIKLFCYKNKNKIYILDTPNHGNLGDQAIALAELNYLKDNFKGYVIIEVNENQYLKYYDLIKKKVNPKDLIFLHGGGNFDDKYLETEIRRRKIVQDYANNKIIMFPQTMFFQDHNILLESLKIYDKHQDFHILLREQESYHRLMKDYQKNVYLVPDIVFYLSGYYKKKYPRKRYVTCFRRDFEKKVSLADTKQVNNLLSAKGKLIITDTVTPLPIFAWNRKIWLKHKFKQLAQAELVITDRLHGVIFCAITNTNCFFFTNYNHKISSTHQTWLKQYSGIQSIDDLTDLKEKITTYKFIEQKYDLSMQKNILIDFANKVKKNAHNI